MRYVSLFSGIEALEIADEIEREYIPREKHEEEVSAIISAQKDSPHCGRKLGGDAS